MLKAILLISIFCASVLAQRPFYRNFNDIGCDRWTEDTDTCPNVSCRLELTCENRKLKADNCEPNRYYMCSNTVCLCKEGYARYEGKCIKYEDCPPKSS